MAPFLAFFFLPAAFCADPHFLAAYAQKQPEIKNVNAFLCGETEKIYGVFQKQNLYTNVQEPAATQAIDKATLNILDLNCEKSQEILGLASAGGHFRNHVHWLILGPSSASLAKYPLLPDSRAVLARPANGTIQLHSVYKIRPESPIISDYLGEWSDDFVFPKFSFEKRKNLGLLDLKTSFVYTEPDSLNHLTDYRDRNIDTQLKLNYVFTSHLYDILNASRDFEFLTSWGEPDGNGSYTGLLGQLYTRRTDISGSPLFCVLERYHIFDCVSMTTPVYGFFIFRKPPLSYVENIFILPFSPTLWGANLIFLSLSAVLLYAAVKWEWILIVDEDSKPQPDQLAPEVQESVMFTIGAVTQQGYFAEPKRATGKIIMITLFLSLIFIFTAYSANTVVLFQSSASNIKTLSDLYESRLELGVDDKPYFRYWFPRTMEPVRRKLYQDRIAPKGQKPKFLPLDVGVAKIRNGYFAFYVDEISGYKVISETFQEHEKCGLEGISFLEVHNPWIVMPKGSSFRDIFKISYRKIQESGIQRRELKKLYSQKPECLSEGSNFRTAGIIDLYAIYVLFFIGLGNSTAILLLEIFIKKYKLINLNRLIK